METDMSANIPVLPIAGGALVRAFAPLAAFVAHWLQLVARARRHRREARQLAKLDRRMLADIGLTRADVADAFSEPFWEDPTALLRERAIERRMNRPVLRTQRNAYPEYSVRRQTPGRPARHAV
jgi:uncharacterized protein YjiS (DUF1127 family)